MTKIRKELRLTADEVGTANNLFGPVGATMDLAIKIRKFKERAKAGEKINEFVDAPTQDHVIQILSSNIGE